MRTVLESNTWQPSRDGMQGLGITIVPTLTLFHFEHPISWCAASARSTCNARSTWCAGRSVSLSAAAQAMYELLRARRPRNSSGSTNPTRRSAPP